MSATAVPLAGRPLYHMDAPDSVVGSERSAAIPSETVTAERCFSLLCD